MNCDEIPLGERTPSTLRVFWLQTESVRETSTVSQMNQKKKKNESHTSGKEHLGSVRDGETEGQTPDAVTQTSPAPSEGSLPTQPSWKDDGKAL